MTNYETLMKNMTPEQLAATNVRLVTVENRRLFYMTSSGQLFPYDKLDEAIQFEYQWLTYDPESERTQNASEVTEGEPDSNEVGVPDKE